MFEERHVAIIFGENHLVNAVKLPVLRSFIHPNYHGITAANDIAIIEFDSSSIKDRLPEPIKLASNYPHHSNASVKGVGFGDYNPDIYNGTFSVLIVCFCLLLLG